MSAGKAAGAGLMDVRMPDIDVLAATQMITDDPELSGVRVLTTFEIAEYVFGPAPPSTPTSQSFDETDSAASAG